MAKYFVWLVFVGAAFVAPNLVPIANIVPYYHFSWLDAFATAAVSYGPPIVFFAFILTLLLALLERLGERWNSPWASMVPRALVFTLFLTSWLRLLRGMLKINKIDVVPIDRPWEVWASVVIAALLLAVSGRSIANWVDTMSGRIRAVAAGILLVVLSLTSYTLIEPLNNGVPAPVTLTGPARDLPNVVIIVLDALTSRDMSLYGYSLPTTPNLDRLARNWTVFEQAHTTATSTLGVQPAILAGRYPYFSQWHHYGDLARAGRGVLNLAQVLQSFGYETTYVIGGGWPPSRYHLHYGFDRILGAGYPLLMRPRNPVHTFPGRNLVNRTLWNPTVAEAILLPRYGALRRSDTTLVEPMYEAASRLLQVRARSQTDAPFFAYLHMNRPHHPYIANEFLGRFLPIDKGLANVGSQLPHLLRHYRPSEQTLFDRLRLRYDENILKADQQVGSLIDSLRELGLYDQSLIIVTADHGASFSQGYEGYFSPLLAATEHSIPLLIKFPHQTEGRRITGAVSTVDILPTVLDVVGTSYPSGWVDGQSLLRTGTDPDRIVIVHRMQLEAEVDFDTVAAISGDLKLVRRKGRDFLYNLATDPDERDNLLGRVSANHLSQALDQFVRRRAFIHGGGDITAAPPLAEQTNAPSVVQQSGSHPAKREDPP